MYIPLKKLREAAGLSQNDLARKTGYSPQFIQKIEQNKAKSITLDAAGRFCDALGCKPGDLLEEGDLPKESENQKLASFRTSAVEKKVSKTEKKLVLDAEEKLEEAA